MLLAHTMRCTHAQLLVLFFRLARHLDNFISFWLTILFITHDSTAALNFGVFPSF